MNLVLRPEAEADIEAISSYIAENNLSAARRWVEELHRCCHRIATNPGIGVPRSDVRPGLRLFPFRRYVILYQEGGRGVEIVRVLHSARQWQSLL